MFESDDVLVGFFDCLLVVVFCKGVDDFLISFGCLLYVKYYGSVLFISKGMLFLFEMECMFIFIFSEV